YEKSKLLQEELLSICQQIHGGKKELDEDLHDIELLILQIETYSGDRQPFQQIQNEWDDSRSRYVPHKPILRIYGVTQKGESILVHVHNFEPYFFVRVKDGFTLK